MCVSTRMHVVCDVCMVCVCGVYVCVPMHVVCGVLCGVYGMFVVCCVCVVCLWYAFECVYV